MSPVSRSSLHITTLTPAGVSKQTLRRWALRARRRLHVPGRISIVIVPPAVSQTLNTRYRRRHRPTNVLSFDYAHAKTAGEHEVDGEIILCPTVIRHEARELGERYQARLKMLLEHGFIHLLGLDHRTVAEQRRWERHEEQLL